MERGECVVLESGVEERERESELSLRVRESLHPKQCECREK